jgi:hypothetical protein
MGAAVALACLLSSVHATTVLPLTFERLVLDADLIFAGRAVSQRSEWREMRGQRSIVTLVTFAVDSVHKGRAGSTVTLQFLGGTVGDITLDVTEMPKFAPGERVLLFVENDGASASPIVGFYHGRLALRPQGGRDAVFKHNGEPLPDTAAIGRPGQKGKPARPAMSLQSFTASLREVLERAGQR